MGRGSGEEKYQLYLRLPAEVHQSRCRVWKILEEGTKIGYRNEEDNLIAPDKTFHLAEVETEEMDDETVFQLHTKQRVFELKAETAQERKEWMRAINMLQK